MKYVSTFTFAVARFLQLENVGPEKWGITAVFADGIASCEGCSIENYFLSHTRNMEGSEQGFTDRPFS